MSTTSTITPHTEMLNDLLKLAVDSGVSDVIVKSNKPGYVRFAGRLRASTWIQSRVPRRRPGSTNTSRRFSNRSGMNEGQVDFAYAAEGNGRFRVNAFHQRGLVSIVLRHVKSTVPSFEQLSLGETANALIKLAQAKDGILLVCGATGSGKSSTMAAMLNWVNQNMDKHIVTIEDPIEYTFQDDKSLFQQREIGLDVPNFQLAIRSVLRQNPDIILIGEMRDRETFETAISAAETGHLVFSTMHASTVSQSLTRLFEFFLPRKHSRRAARSPVRCGVHLPETHSDD